MPPRRPSGTTDAPPPGQAPLFGDVDDRPGTCECHAIYNRPGSSLRSKQLKSNAVTTAKIKREAVTTAKLTKAGVTGDQLAGSSVATDKIADQAVTSGKLANGAVTTDKLANGAVTAEKLSGPIGADQIGPNAVGNSQTQLVKVFKGEVVSAGPSEAGAPRIELGSVGPFKFYGKCFLETGNIREKTYIELTSGQATLGSEDGAEMPIPTNEVYLTPATLEKDRAMEDDASAGPNKVDAGSNDEEFQAHAGDGTEITGLIGGTGAKQGTPPIGNGPFLAGDSCIVGTVAIFGG